MQDLKELKSQIVSMIQKLSYEKREVKLASGRVSDFYVDMKHTLLHPAGIDMVSTYISESLRPMFDQKIQGCGGMTMGADPISTAVSMKSLSWKNPLPAFYIRKEPKGHGTGQWIEGMKNFKKGDSVIILEDVVTSGGSSLKAAERAQEGGLKVLGIFTCVDREEGGREKILEAGFQFFSIATKSEIVRL